MAGHHHFPVGWERGGRGNHPTLIHRFPTPRRRNGRWLTDVSPLFPLLTAQTCEFTMQTGGETWIADELSLRFSGFAEEGVLPGTTDTPPPALPASLYNCVWDNPSTSFKSSDYNQNRTLMVPIPPGTTRLQIVAIISGHGGCEFIPTSHHFLVNGEDYNTTAAAPDVFMNAGSDYGCTDFVSRGASPNEHGTWYVVGSGAAPNA